MTATHALLLTGATGHIGSRLLPVLRRDYPGLTLRASAPDAPTASEDGIEWVRADFTDPACDYEGLVQGMDDVWHLGAATQARAASMDEINVAGTRELAAAAARAGVRRFLFTSTALAYGYRKREIVEDGQPLEAAPWFPSRDIFTAYGRSKFEAERAIEQLDRSTMQVMILRLCVVSSRERARASLASYSKAQRLAWAGRYWHILDADETAQDLSNLLNSEAWPAPGAIAYYNYSADAHRCLIGDIVGTLPPDGPSRQAGIAAALIVDRFRSWQRNGWHGRRRGFPNLVYDSSGLSGLGIRPQPARPDCADD
ncbi:NAD-dependent epimerase/dehydratase family protein [Parerythrobacter aestuarii]|uniref:NAD-dependent epimerase/dehydratase family protein n=1 Tax=Parerythrobacter aestuarii TaxID=3020909 RepID=UPI0024DE4C60|nr:NAD-dependent epimerase/dehydratase family protein [Parerythrobacter aestuarii]